MLLSLAKFGAMSSEERARALDALTSTPPNGAGIDAEIRELEVRYEMRSLSMLDRWRRRELPDTADFSRWLVLLSARGDR
jgi:hypothetical protein